MFGKTIRSEVLGKVKKMIDQKEAEYKAGTKKLAEQAMVQMEAVRRENEAKKAELREKCVNDILGKIL